jgi:hypothetical protein
MVGEILNPLLVANQVGIAMTISQTACRTPETLVKSRRPFGSYKHKRSCDRGRHEGQARLRPWEQIFYGEFDGRRKKRVLVKLIGA